MYFLKSVLLKIFEKDRHLYIRQLKEETMIDYIRERTVPLEFRCLCHILAVLHWASHFIFSGFILQ